MKIESHHGAEHKALYRIVRLDSGMFLEGDINSADEDTGEASMKVKLHDGTAADRTYALGARGIKIVERSLYRR
jgi:hypothetical protein